MAFFQQLRRRKVIRSAVAYLAGAWLVLQVADTILPYLGERDWIIRCKLLALVMWRRSRAAVAGWISSFPQ